VAFHRADADGVISAVVVKNAHTDENIVFIPIDYDILELEEFGSYLSNLPWYAIVDLPPFAKSSLYLFSDHHQSNVDVKVNAQIILFNPEAPSAAALLAAHFQNIDEKTKELAKLTEITDTAGYTIPAPLETKSEYISEQERAWALNDVCKSLDTLEEIVELVDKLALEGFDAITRYYNERITRHRSKRKRSIDRANQLETSDMVILNFSDDSLNRFAILHELLNRGAKVGVATNFFEAKYVLNFRHSKQLSKEEVIQYRVDTLAEKFGGGGHMSASGARVDDVHESIKEIVLWGKKKGLNPIVQEIQELNEK
ncbi:MAG: hypothetical protein ACW96X_07715, partial [Promethearchaeota archaeon]